MGLATLSLPWLFNEVWPVVLLAGLSIVTLLAMRLVRFLKENVGGILGGVRRFSLGEVYFPIAVALLFVLFQRDTTTTTDRKLMLYCIPLLLLTLADATAALIGTRYGQWRYPTADGDKSAEGSLGFFFSGFFSVHIPLLLFTDVGRAETLLIAVLLAWLAMLFEAIAWRGLDNLILPLVSYLLLKIYFGLDAAELVTRLIVTGVLSVFLLAYRTRSTLVGSGVLGAFLVGYISWALGGWHWLLPPLVLFFTYTLLSPRTEANTRRIHNIDAVLSVCAAGLIWLFLAKELDRPDFIFPYTLTFAANLAIIGIARLRFDYPKMPATLLLSICITKGWLLLFLPYLLAEGFTEATWSSALLALAAVAAAALTFYATQPGIEDCPTDAPRWLRQGGYAALVSLLGLVPLQWS
jgi:phytol kinase